MADDPVTRLALRLTDGETIDWGAESAAQQIDVRLLDQLCTIQALASVNRQPPDRFGSESVDSLANRPGPAESLLWGHLFLIERIGQGSFGEVYRARDTHLGRDVALKLLRGPTRPDTKSSGLIHEGHLLGRIRHPNVVTVYGADCRGGQTGLWMELIAGETLEEELRRRGPFSPKEVAEAGVVLSDALSAVHGADLLHRDIKAQNVMRDATGRLVLMDFGAGHVFDQPAASSLVGTPLYVAPEMLRGGSASRQSDIYALGVLLWHLLTNDYPVNGTSLNELRVAHDAMPHLNLRGDGAVDSQLVSILRKCVAPVPTDRFSTAAALYDALKQWLVLSERMRTAWSTKFVTTVAILSLSSTALISLQVVATRDASADSAEQQAYIAALSAADAQIRVAHASSSSTRDNAMQEAERRLLEVPKSRRNWEWHYLLRQLDPSTETLWGTRTFLTPRIDHYQGPLVVTPDGRRVLWASSYGVHEWDIGEQKLTQAFSGQGWILALAEDGSQLLSANWQQKHPWRVVDTRSGTIVATLNNDDSLQSAVFSPDGSLIAAVTQDLKLHTWSAKSGDRLTSIKLEESPVAVRFGPLKHLITVVNKNGLVIWDMTSKRQRVLPSPSGDRITVADVSPDEDVIVTGDAAGVLRRWSGTSVHERIIGQHAGLRLVRMTRDAGVIASADGGGRVQLWQLSTPAMTVQGDTPRPEAASTVLSTRLDRIDALGFTHAGARLIAASTGGVIAVFDTASERLSQGISYEQFGVPGVRLPPSIAAKGQRIAVYGFGKLNRSVYTIDLGGIVPRPAQSVTHWLEGSELVAVNPDGTETVIGHSDGSVILPMPNNGVFVVARGEGHVTALAFAAGGQQVVAAWSSQRTFGAGMFDQVAPPEGQHGRIAVFDRSSARELARIDVPMVVGDVIPALGNRVLIVPPIQFQRNVASPPHCVHPIQMWDYFAHRVRYQIHECPSAVAVSPNGDRIAIYSAFDKILRMRDAQSGVVKWAADQSSPVIGLAFNPDGSRLAARSQGSMSILDGHGGRLLLTVPAPEASDFTRTSGGELQWSSDGNRLISADTWGLNVWDGRPRPNADALVRLRRALGVGFFWSSTDRQKAPVFVDDLAETIRADQSLDAETRKYALTALTQIGERDTAGVCDAVRAMVTTPGKTQDEYYKAARMVTTAVGLEPWSAYCVGILAMAKYRTADFGGAVDTADRAKSIRGDAVPAELAFKAMALQRLGRSADAADLVAELSKRPEEPDSTWKRVLAELASVMSTEIHRESRH